MICGKSSTKYEVLLNLRSQSMSVNKLNDWFQVQESMKPLVLLPGKIDFFQTELEFEEIKKIIWKLLKVYFSC